jgi:hypothetical protein
MNNKKELEERIEAIKNIYFSAKVSFSDAEYLYLPDTEEEKKIAAENLFVHRIRISCWRNVVLELCKLYLDSDNEHFNLFKFLRNLKSEYKGISQTNQVSDEKIDSWIQELTHYKVVEIVKRLKTIRDKHIAHTDIDSKSNNNQVRVTFKETREIFEVTEKLLSEIISSYLNGYQIFDIAGTEKAGHILKIIHEHHKWYFERLKTNNA